VINRGNYRQAIFGEEGAAQAFETCLEETCARCGWRLHAYVVMRNHFHLAVETPEPNLSTGMKWLQGTWANRFNRYRGLTGRPFQGRYKALHVEPGHALAQVAHYIHLNPVRAHATPVAALAQFRWSSLWWFPRKDRPAWLESTTVLAAAGQLADTQAGWRKYAAYLEVLAEESPREREKKFGRLSRGWAVGTKGFRQDLIRDLNARANLLQADGLHGETIGERLAFRQDVWEERLAAIAEAAGINLNQLGPRKSDPAKVLLAAVMKATTGVANGWLQERLAMGTPASVSQFVRRFRLQGGMESRPYRKVMSIIKT
jgi:REP element-mobilizing transposase RayT